MKQLSVVKKPWVGFPSSTQPNDLKVLGFTIFLPFFTLFYFFQFFSFSRLAAGRFFFEIFYIS
ncbi:hypothetical protein NIES3807_29500 [Microcystis aeruginosa NIES-3807]|uniref:Uncharacterized protein n=1 Tax=Microcystis aeruginosa NIES-3807 TaxID=2517785 RepID=A0AAD3B233_MICAE|nr:hypothetical protein NIES3807_29500 [Microcystis aeruginosa NIES-3807]